MTPQRFLERLLFDQELRARFAADRGATLAAHGVEAPGLFADLDLHGLELDAQVRRRYLMSALCRPFPLSAAALGAAPGGPARLSAFLASPHLFGPLGARTAAFGDHLARLLALADLPPVTKGLLQANLGWERALVDNAAALREAAARGEAPGLPPKPAASALKKGRLTLPPYLLAAELPLPTGLLRAALDGVSAADAWARVEAGALDPGRVVTVSRADPVPVTMLARGYVAGMSQDRAGAGGVAPLVDVRHLTVELSGRQGALLAMLQERPRLRDLPAARARVLRRLAEAGVLDAIR
ncbi:MAG: hypothetical protein H6739_14955 [Alphaproteobacteria bacterium]|nr:hypothetical protein [Alphaproteobacteria bacterium]